MWLVLSNQLEVLGAKTEISNWKGILSLDCHQTQDCNIDYWQNCQSARLAIPYNHVRWFFKINLLFFSSSFLLSLPFSLSLSLHIHTHPLLALCPWRTLIEHKLPRRRNGQICNCISIHELGPMTWLNGQDLEETLLENWERGSLEKKYMDRLLWMGQKCQKINWRYLCPLWMFTKQWPQHRKILIIKWTG